VKPKTASQGIRPVR